MQKRALNGDVDYKTSKQKRKRHSHLEKSKGSDPKLVKVKLNSSVGSH